MTVKANQTDAQLWAAAIAELEHAAVKLKTVALRTNSDPVRQTAHREAEQIRLLIERVRDEQQTLDHQHRAA